MLAIVLSASGLLPKEYTFTAESMHKVFMKQDSWWYKQIAEEGYRELRNEDEIGFSHKSEFTQSEWAFFPLYPLLLRLPMALGLSFEASALILSLILSSLGFLLFYQLASRWLREKRKAYVVVLTLMLFPFNYYFSMYYSEMLFLVLLLLAFYAVVYRKWWVLGISASLLALNRPNGLVVLLPIFVFYLEQNALISGFSLKEFGRKRGWLVVSMLAFGPLMFAVYCWFQFERTGFFTAFSIAQKGWYRELTWPFLSFFRHGDVATQFNSFYTLLLIIAAFLLRKKLPLSFILLIWLSILLPLFSGSVLSMPRFVSLIFPLFLFVGAAIASRRRPYITLSMLFLLQLGSFIPWLLEMPLAF